MEDETQVAQNIPIDKDGFIPVYKKLPEKPATTIRFFERHDKYVLYDSDAHFVEAEILGIAENVNVRKLQSSTGSNTLDYLTLNRSQFENFVRDLLLVKQYRVEVWVNQKSGWGVEYRGSPGNLCQFEDLLFSNTDVTVNNGVLGVRIKSSDKDKNKTVGLGYINLNESVLSLVEFLDNDALTNFESVLVQLGPKEAVILGTGGSAGQSEELFTLRTILERNHILLNDRKLTDFDSKDILQDLGRLVKPSETDNLNANPEIEKTIAVSALAAAIKYLSLLSNEAYFNTFSISPFDMGLYVKMDSAAVEALHITQNPMEIGKTETLTLCSVLDRCKTPQGHRLLAQFLRQPLVNLNKLEERLDLVETFVYDIVLRETLIEDYLKRVPDCQGLAKKFFKKKATLADCYKSYQILRKIPKLVEELESRATELDESKKVNLEAHFIEPLKLLKSDCEKFVEMIETTIDLKLAEEGEFMIRPDFDDTLQDLRNGMDIIKTRMEAEARKAKDTLNLDDKSLKLEFTSLQGYHFRVTLKDEKSLRSHKEFQILDSSKAGVRFRSSKLDGLNDDYAKKLHIYEETQKEFKDDVMEVACKLGPSSVIEFIGCFNFNLFAAGYYTNFEQLGNILAFLDVMISFAHVSSNSPLPFIRPVLHPSGTGILKFNELRHPCVEAQPGTNFIPNDVDFDKSSKSFYIVTGPNMGGKSTFLRSVGVSTLLAHIGCFVPASSAEISVVDAILARVGASDCLIKGVSTFMAEMIETSFILKTATNNSLVLIDELGRGTSTYDGFGLCWAISEFLASRVNCFTILATHFHELSKLADEIKTVTNVHVTALASENGLTMLYKIEPGPCDRSFGLHVAEVTDFPPEVIQRAKEMAKKLEDFSTEQDLDDSEEAVKRRAVEKKTGQELIDNFFSNLQDLTTKYPDPSDIETFRSEAKKLLKEFESTDNSYIKHVLETFEF